MAWAIIECMQRMRYLSNGRVCAVCLCLAGLVVVMAVVFVIVKVEPCICQSNRLENFNNDLYHDTRKSGSILSHTHTLTDILQAQVAN